MEALASLDKTQYGALRIIIGCIRSTPINILLLETRELPPHLKIIWFAIKGKETVSGTWSIQLVASNGDFGSTKIDLQ